jgi:hypothetical protein
VNRDVVERVRRAIYDTFAGQGHAPGTQQIRELAAVDEAQVKSVFPLWAGGPCGGAGVPGTASPSPAS